MFLNTFYELCRKNNTYPLTVVKETGIATGSITKWKNGTVPSGATLQKLADYFAVPVDYLLGRGNKRTRRLPQFHYLKAQSTITTVILYLNSSQKSTQKPQLFSICTIAQLRYLRYVEIAQKEKQMFFDTLYMPAPMICYYFFMASLNRFEEREGLKGC